MAHLQAIPIGMIYVLNSNEAEPATTPMDVYPGEIRKTQSATAKSTSPPTPVELAGKTVCLLDLLFDIDEEAAANKSAV